MAAKDEEAFLKRLLATFRVEAAEHLQAMGALLMELERPAAEARRAQLVESLFRETHSLKGAARSVNLADIEGRCRDMESLLARVKRREIELAPEMLRSVSLGLAELERLLGARFDAAPAAETAPAPVAAETAAAMAIPSGVLVEQGDTVRIATAKLAALMVQAEELLAFKASLGHMADELAGITGLVADWTKTSVPAWRDVRSLRREQEHRTAAGVEGLPIAGLGRVLEAPERDEFFAKALGDGLTRLRSLARREERALAAVADGLQEAMREALMQPFGALLELMPKLVRDLARDSGKEIDLHLEGAAIEIDRRILEQIKDPLIHLVRNAIDHGIEAPAERSRRGKPTHGRIDIVVTAQEGNKVELAVIDDGAGIDVDKVRTAAARLEAGPREAANVADPLDLIFESGLSTSPILTDLSGRGLGLAIVREKVEKIGGRAVAERREGGGTRMRVELPTTLAAFRGLLVAVGERRFVLPAQHVERVARLRADAVRTVENRESIEIGGEILALARLADVLELPPAAAGGQAEQVQVVLLESGGRRIAFVVDAVLGDQEVLVKGLGPQLRRVVNIAGATVLGAGQVVPILGVPDLMKSALRPQRRHEAPQRPAAAPAEPLSLLVADDSITSRSLLKSILESAGFRVTTAVDGIDALTTLRSGQFDLLVSDVEMPRMDGFELTARVRADRRLADLPVVLVTALESREDRERGIDAGASAYIVKSSFDQGNLLDIVRRLA